ncbi:hypothetical protein BHE74_00046304 [Ensete ventricosum]|nr:hypothetical protein BHE74_00046304 [Ensete ventricosum]
MTRVQIPCLASNRESEPSADDNCEPCLRGSRDAAPFLIRQRDVVLGSEDAKDLQSSMPPRMRCLPGSIPKSPPSRRLRRVQIFTPDMLETVHEIAIYIHRFHNLDLFQQGYSAAFYFSMVSDKDKRKMGRWQPGILWYSIQSYSVRRYRF